MYNFITKFHEILEVCKLFSGNHVNARGNTIYGCKLHALCSITGVIRSFDSTATNVHDLPYLDDVKWDCHGCTILGDKEYPSTSGQQDLFESAKIRSEVPYRLNQKNWQPPTWAYKRFRKRIETVFSQLIDQLLMIRNYVKQTDGFFTRTAAKTTAFTMCYKISISSTIRKSDRLNMYYLNSINRLNCNI